MSIDEKSTTVYVQLRPRHHTYKRCMNAVQELSRVHKNIVVELSGLSRDNYQVDMTFGIDVPYPFDERAQECLSFVNTIFETLFDYMPRMTAEPTEPEKQLVKTFLQDTHLLLGAK